MRVSRLGRTRMGLVAALVALGAGTVAASAAQAAVLAVQPNITTVPQGGTGTYSLSMAGSQGPWQFSYRIDSLVDSEYGSLAECGPFPRTEGFDGSIPAGRVLCSYTRTVDGPVGSKLTNTVTLIGSESGSPDNPPIIQPIPPHPISLTASATVKVVSKCAKKKGNARKKCKRRLKQEAGK